MQQEEPYYSDVKRVNQSIGEVDSFAEYVKKLTQFILYADDDFDRDLRPITNSDTKALEAVNEYLEKEGQEPLNLSNITHVPSDIEIAYLKLLSGPALNSDRHIFNSGADSIARSSSKERQGWLADLYEALGAYYDERHPSRETYNNIKLWKKDVELEDGNVKGGEIKQVDFFSTKTQAILRVPGVSNMHRRTDLADYFVSMTESMLGNDAVHEKQWNGERAEMYILSYPYQNLLSFSAEIHRLNSDPSNYVSPKFQDFVNNVMLPSFSIDSTTERLGLGELKTALRHFTLLSNSYGTVAAIQIQNAVAQRLGELGYSREIICEAMPSVYHQSVFPVNYIDKEPSPNGCFSTYYFVSSNDLTSLGRSNVRDYSPKTHNAAANMRVNKHTLMRWIHAPLEGINLFMRQVNGDAVDAPIKIPQMGHDPVLGMHDIEQPDGTIYSNSLVRYALRRGINRSYAAPDLVSQWSGKVKGERHEPAQETDRGTG